LFSTDCPDSWILEENIAEDLLQDYAEGMEYAQLRDTFVIPPGFSDSTVRNVRLNTVSKGHFTERGQF